jgi:homoserine kinase
LPDRPIWNQTAHSPEAELSRQSDGTARGYQELSATGDGSAQTALVVAALTGPLQLLLEATEDFLHQRHRAAAMPTTAELVSRLRRAGIGAVVAGAGPAVLALTVARAQSGAGTVSQIAAVAGARLAGTPLGVDPESPR